MGIWIPGGLSNSDGGSYTPPEWSTGSDEEIIEVLQKHYNGEIDLTEYWSVGDERVVSLSAMEATGVGESHVAQSVTFVLSNIGGKYLSDGVTECLFQVDQKDCLNEKGYMYMSYDNSCGWIYASRRTWCNNTYKNAIPSTLREIFKEFINTTGSGGYSSSTQDTNDYFALRAEIEISGQWGSSVGGEGTQVDWYKTASNRTKKINGSADKWWERSPYNGDDYSFCCVNNVGSSSNHDYAPSTLGIAPFGVI